MQLTTERHQQIEKFVQKHKRATVAELSNFLKVSEPTIRRDLEKLDEAGKIRREHGGAVALEQATPEPPIMQRMAVSSDEKHRIGLAAAELVHDGETVFIGSGTTTLEVARQLGSRKNLTVITNALSIANELSKYENVTVIITGGVLRHSEASVIGHLVEQTLRELRADKVIMSMRAISVQEGLTNDNLMETMTDRFIVQLAREVILVADHTKFDKVSTVVVAPITAVHKVVTDKDTPLQTVEQLQALGITVIQV
jgi:DeoR/GlpR family transcriptional regulator of sugar metabolism